MDRQKPPVCRIFDALVIDTIDMDKTHPLIRWQINRIIISLHAGKRGCDEDILRDVCKPSWKAKVLQTRQSFESRVIRLEFFGEQPDCLIHKLGLSRQMLWVTINSRLESCARIDIMLTILVVLILTPEEIRHLHARTNVETLVLRRYAQSQAQNVFN